MPNKLCISLQDIILNTNPQQFSFTIVKSTRQQTTTTHILLYKNRTKSWKKRNDNASLVARKSLQILFYIYTYKYTNIYVHTYKHVHSGAKQAQGQLYIVISTQSAYSPAPVQGQKEKTRKNIQSARKYATLNALHMNFFYSHDIVAAGKNIGYFVM